MTAVTPTTRHDMILLTQADLDGELTAAEAMAIASHRAGCAKCKAVYRMVMTARAAVQTLGTRHALPAAVRQALIEWQRQAGSLRR